MILKILVMGNTLNWHIALLDYIQVLQRAAYNEALSHALYYEVNVSDNEHQKVPEGLNPRVFVTTTYPRGSKEIMHRVRRHAV